MAMTWDLLSRSVTHGIVPGLVGGPWDWQRWAPASPWATPPMLVMVLGWLALAAVLAVSLVRKQRIGPVWLAAAGYAVACQIPIYLMRSSRFTALELAQTLRYLPDLVVVLALLAAVGFCAPNRQSSRRLDASPAPFGGNGLRRSGIRRQQPLLDGDVPDDLAGQPRAAVSAERARGLAAANAASDAPLLDQEVDPLVLQRVAYPENLASHMFALLRDRPEFASATSNYGCSSQRAMSSTPR